MLYTRERGNSEESRERLPQSTLAASSTSLLFWCARSNTSCNFCCPSILLLWPGVASFPSLCSKNDARIEEAPETSEGAGGGSSSVHGFDVPSSVGDLSATVLSRVAATLSETVEKRSSSSRRTDPNSEPATE